MRPILYAILVLAVLTLVYVLRLPSPAGAGMASPASLPDLGPAPELSNTTWLNVDAPLRLADLRGKVVLIDMWTFG